MDIRFWVGRYINEGWSPIPIPAGEKGPRTSGWEEKTFTLADFEDDNNIGVHLGRNGLYDVDLDDKHAAIAADVLLPNTPRVSGRPGKPRSHRWFTVTDDKILHAHYFGLGGQNDTIVELRGWTKRDTPEQTVVPPSLHGSGETIAWDSEGQPLIVEAKVLRESVRNVAIATLLARHFPGPGHRHVPRMAMAGFLCRAGLEEPTIKAIGRAVMRLTGGDVNDWNDVCGSTFAKHKAGEQVSGGPTLAAALTDGEAVLRRLNHWLGRETQAAVEDAIDRLNQHYFIVKAGTKVVVADESDADEGIKLWPFDEFKKIFVKDFMPGERLPDKVSKTGIVTPGKMKKGRNVAEAWLEHPRGRQHDRLVYAPEGSGIHVGPRDYNGWKGYAVVPAAGPWDLIRRHLEEVICAGDSELFGWLVNWIASLVQQPGQHAWTALVLRGGQGTGKGFFAHDLLGGLFHRRHYALIIDREQFYGRFNDVLSGRCLVYLDEATWGGSKTDEGVLKGRITSDLLTIDRKHLPALVERSMLHLIVGSNNDWPVAIDTDDRRICALNAKNIGHKNDPNYFGPLYAELRGGGHGAFLKEMLEWTVVEELLRQPPMTSGKDELKKRSLPPEADWFLDRLHDGKLLVNQKSWTPKVSRMALYNEYVAAMQLSGVNRRLTPTHFGRALRKWYPNLKDERTKGQREYVFGTLTAVRSAMEKFLGSPEQWDDPSGHQQSIPDDEGPF